MSRAAPCRIGIISDTHGLLRPTAIELLRGADHIVHAGDIGSEQILAALRAIAPLTAVRGNNDTQAWAASIAEAATLEIGGRRVHVIHEISKLSIDPAAAGMSVVIFGHSHKPSIEKEDGVLYVNPGSAGPRRFKLPTTIAQLSIGPRTLRPEIVTVPLG
jgi:putative phosphoesterase